MSFASYKKNRKDIEALTKSVEAIDAGKNKFPKDERFYRLQQDKAGNGSAVLRFLPEPEGEDLPYVTYGEHNFKNEDNGTFLAEYCPVDLGRPCPVHDAIKPLWAGNDEDKAIAQARKKNVHYISNVLILKDPAAPENVGKVFLFKYGVKIWEKIKLQLKPKDEDDPRVNVFDFYDGADFRLEVKKVKSYNNYDDSSFKAPSSLYKGDDEKLAKVYESLHKLTPFSDTAKYKSYDELAKKYDEVVNGKPKTNIKTAEDLFKDVEKAEAPKKVKAKAAVANDEDDTAPWKEAVEKPKSRKAKAQQPVVEEEDTEITVETDDDNSELDYYNELANK